MSYSTQMDAAKKGIFTKQMEDVLKEETHITKDFLMQKVSQGKIAIPANKNHINIIAKGVEDGLKTKVNVNLGVSEECNNYQMELDKVKNAAGTGSKADRRKTACNKSE